MTKIEELLMGVPEAVYATAWGREAVEELKRLQRLHDRPGSQRASTPCNLHSCDNCGKTYAEESLVEAKDLNERLDFPVGHPDRIEPSGECPDCGALCYPGKEDTEASGMKNKVLAALRAAQSVARQHNLLSTATEQERSDTIKRHLDWWNHTARPVVEMAEGQSVMSVIEVDLTGVLVYETPDEVPEWQWIQRKARFAHVGNDVEPGVYEFMIRAGEYDYDDKRVAEERLSEVPEKLRPFIEKALAVGAPWVLFHQG